jgi:hypothetical protein
MKDAPFNLASIFYRFKPLFLAMKSISRHKRFYNQLRRGAIRMHRPMPESYLDNVTAGLKQGVYNPDALERELSRVNIFRKVRLANALLYRKDPPESILYRVRNGRAWAKSFEWLSPPKDIIDEAIFIIEKSIALDLREKVGNKNIFIPPGIRYAVPATEKQFTGNLPSGSSVQVEQDMVVGIHWVNNPDRVDLDLSVISEVGKFGWDASYRDAERSVLFSGDLTSAPPPKGASEFFYIKEQQKAPHLLMVNYYNYHANNECECKVIVGHEVPESFYSGYMLDVNKILATALVNITEQQTCLGLIEGNRMFFSQMRIGHSITARKAHSQTTREYLVHYTKSTLDLGQMLSLAGAIVVNKKPKEDFLDLSPEALDKTTILNLIS